MSESQHFHDGVAKFLKMFQAQKGEKVVRAYLCLLEKQAVTSYWKAIMHRYRVEFEQDVLDGRWV